MKTVAVVCNILMFAFTCVVLATDGAPKGAPYVVLTLLLLAVPIVSAVVIARSEGSDGRPGLHRLVAAACNVILLGFACWAFVSTYPHPAEPGFIPFVVLVALTPILSLVALLRGRAGSGWLSVRTTK